MIALSRTRTRFGGRLTPRTPPEAPPPCAGADPPLWGVRPPMCRVRPPPVGGHKCGGCVPGRSGARRLGRNLSICSPRFYPSKWGGSCSVMTVARMPAGPHFFPRVGWWPLAPCLSASGLRPSAVRRHTSDVCSSCGSSASFLARLQGVGPCGRRQRLLCAHTPLLPAARPRAASELSALGTRACVWRARWWRRAAGWAAARRRCSLGRGRRPLRGARSTAPPLTCWCVLQRARAPRGRRWGEAVVHVRRTQPRAAWVGRGGSRSEQLVGAQVAGGSKASAPRGQAARAGRR